jgi:two-component system OmpR family response regulator
MTKSKLLIAEDDPNLGQILKEYLELKGYNAKLVKDGEEAIMSFRQNEYDLCILDVMMPKKDGFSLAKDIRAVNKDVPLIFLTAKSMKEDVLRGYQVGADDYLNKPFDSEILLHKIKAILQRKETDSANDDNQFEFEIGNFHLNSKLRQLSFKGEEPRKLSPKENKLLKLLAIYKNDLLPRELALTKIWRDDNYFTSRSMDVYIAKLRKYLRPDERVEIINIHGEGFRLVED